MKDLLTTLKDAYALIQDKENWIIGYSARNASGEVVDPWDSGAVKFCAAGAIWRASTANPLTASETEAGKAFDALGAALHGYSIPTINDSPGGHERICEGFEKAIADIEAKTKKKKPDLFIA